MKGIPEVVCGCLSWQPTWSLKCSSAVLLAAASASLSMFSTTDADPAGRGPARADDEDEDTIDVEFVSPRVEVDDVGFTVFGRVRGTVMDQTMLPAWRENDMVTGVSCAPKIMAEICKKMPAPVRIKS